MTDRSLNRTSRVGFTLVEMLVVIVIITALAAILIPAVFITIGKAKQAKIGMEVANISRALERYKMDYGEYPPDLTAAWDAGQNQMNVDAVKQIINTHLSTHFRRRAADDFPTDSELAVLSPETALVFWLKGFSPNPQYPITGTGDRSPFFDFDKSRATEAIPGAAHVFRYAPAGDTERKAYLYYSAEGYRDFEAPGPMPTGDPSNYPPVKWANDNQTIPPYFSSTLGKFAQPEKFQLIAAGLDSDFGLVEPSDQTDIAKYPTVPNGRNCKKNHKDNITNFSEGTVGDMIKD